MRPLAIVAALALLTLDSKKGPSGSLDVSASPAQRLVNRTPYIPPMCFTKTRGDDGKPKNPCYVCHTHSEAPDFADDGDLQSTLQFPVPATHNPWTNLLAPPSAHAPPSGDAEVLAYVRQSNYFDPPERGGGITLARVLSHPPAAWDLDRNGRWDGFVPDVEYRIDDRGFDHAADGTPTGWRAFAYYPFPGTFFPTNGSADDVFIRLDPALREDASGQFDRTVYEVNLAVVEALMTRADVSIDPIDEAALGIDLDLDGHLGRATHVAFDDAKDGKGGTPMRYVGRARSLQERGDFPIGVGLFPLGTEFFHTVRYLDVGPDGVVRMAARMKEVRYAKKARWLPYDRLRWQAADEARETSKHDGTHVVHWLGELGVYNERAWYLQAFIEARDGSLRPQSPEEESFCEGCHGGIGATTDSVFSFTRKLGTQARAHGWFHGEDLQGIAEPKRSDGQYEYTLYLREAGAGDELRANDEVRARFFDAAGALRADEVEWLHGDIARLLVPSAGRALDLDRAYRAVVLEQSFYLGRDAVLATSANVLAEVERDAKTGIEHPVVATRLAR